MFKLNKEANIALINGGWPTAFADCIIAVFSGTPPEYPEDGVTAGNVLLARIGANQASWIPDTPGSDGIAWSNADANGIVKPSNLGSLSIVGLTTGIARWFWVLAHNAAAYNFAANVATPRAQGIVGTDLRLSTQNITAGVTSSVSSLDVRFPLRGV